MRYIFLIFLCSCAHAETFKLEARTPRGPQPEDGKFIGITCFGNAFAVSKNTLLTCWHVVEGKDENRVLIGEKWHTVTVVKKDEKDDLCLLKIEGIELKPVEFKATKLVTVGAEMDKDIKEHTVEAKWGYVKSNYTVGISGSPVFDDGKLFGMITRVDRRVDPSESKFISSAVIKAFLKD